MSPTTNYTRSRSENGHPLTVTVPNVPYFIPETLPKPGSVIEPSKDVPLKLPKIFTPLKIRSLEFKNRMFLSPMAQYSAEPGTGMPSDWHMVHYGQFAIRGIGYINTEACSVTPNGRITPEDIGIWSDEHIPAYKRMTDFIHSQGGLCGIQLAHAGRRASTYTPTLMIKNPDLKCITAPPEAHGWNDVWSASAIPYYEKYITPIAMTKADIESFKKSWAQAVERSIKAGFDVAEVHASHGYLLHNFMSPLSNQRTDEYGGSLENRMRLPLEIAQLTRSMWPSDKPVFCRVSATDWHVAGEKDSKGNYISWGIEQTKIFAQRLEQIGIDMIDVTSGGNDFAQRISPEPAYNVRLAREVRKVLKKAVLGSVGLITSPSQAERILSSGDADVISLGRELLRRADFVLDAAREFGVDIQLPNQYHRSIIWKDEVIPGPTYFPSKL